MVAAQEELVLEKLKSHLRHGVFQCNFQYMFFKFVLTHQCEISSSALEFVLSLQLGGAQCAHVTQIQSHALQFIELHGSS